MFINDIVKEIHSNIRLFADDTSLYIIVDFPDSAAQILKLDLERLYNWAVQWLVKFNPIKTESLLFSRRVNLRDHPTLFFNDVPIQEVVSHKRFGTDAVSEEVNTFIFIAVQKYIKLAKRFSQ